MDEMPKVDVKALLPVVREQIEEAVQKIMQAVNNAAAGELITGSPEAARGIGHELTRAVYRSGVATANHGGGSRFPPSGGPDDGSSSTQ